MTSPLVHAYRGEAWTIADLQELPSDGQEYEIFDGSLLVSPHADVFHGGVANRLRQTLDRQAPSGLFVGHDIGVRHRRSYFVPDIFVVRESALEKGGPAFDPIDVLLVVEVVSPTNAARNLVLKRHEYAAAGIPHYWLVEPRKQTLTVLEHSGVVYRDVAVVGPGERWQTGQPFDLALDLTTVF